MMNYKVVFSFVDGKILFLFVGYDDLFFDVVLCYGINLLLDCCEGVCGICMGCCEVGSYSLDYVDEDIFFVVDLEQCKVFVCQIWVCFDVVFYFDFVLIFCYVVVVQVYSGVVCELCLFFEDIVLFCFDVGVVGCQLDFLFGQYVCL